MTSTHKLYLRFAVKIRWRDKSVVSRTTKYSFGKHLMVWPLRRPNAHFLIHKIVSYLSLYDRHSTQTQIKPGKRRPQTPCEDRGITQPHTTLHTALVCPNQICFPEKRRECGVDIKPVILMGGVSYPATRTCTCANTNSRVKSRHSSQRITHLPRPLARLSIHASDNT